jgi:triosephosphate isomerase
MTDSQRRPIAAANWKMHKIVGEASAFCRQLVRDLGQPHGEVIIFPSAPLLPAVATALQGSAASWGGQDIHPAEQGAHTGDISGAQLKDAGCSWVLCGHSERRSDHHESSQLVAQKAAAAVRAEILPMVCVGETMDERRAGQTFPVLQSQLDPILEDPPPSFALAYEPVWAIGTGETATPKLAQEAHRFLREHVRSRLGSVADTLRILYGGSVKPGNAAELIAQPDVDGFLIGGASLEANSFLSIIQALAPSTGP